MAGTTRKVKREWSKFTSLQSAGTAIEDPFKCIYEELNHVVTDLTTLSTLAAELQTLVNQLRSADLNQALNSGAFVISTNFDTKNGTAIAYTNAGTLKSLSANTNFDTGTTQVIVADKWSAALLSIDASGAAILTWSATLNAATEAAAILDLPALPAGNTPVGYITVLTGSGVTWTAGTDALQSGTGGTPATTTHYFNSINPNAAIIGAASASSATTVAAQLSTIES